MVKTIIFLMIICLWFLLPVTVQADTTIYIPIVEAKSFYTYYWPMVNMPLQLPKQGISSPYSNCNTILQSSAYWYYDWSASPGQCYGEVRAYAMLWGWYAEGELPAIPWYVEGVMGGNECDLPQQCNIAPEKYATLWRHIEQAYPEHKLIAPAPSPWGRAWLSNMVAEYQRLYHANPRFDKGLAMHCYFPTAAECLAELEWYKQMAQQLGAPGVWITEWTILPCQRTTMNVLGQPSISAALAEADKLRQAFEADPQVLGHAWFADYIRNEEWWAFQPVQCDTSLFDQSGYLTAFGLWYTMGKW